MNDNAKSPLEEQTPANDTDAAPAVTGENGAEDGADARLAEMEAELGALKDRLMRAVAETENVRRRAERDKADAAAYGATALARDMLDVADNLRRALDAVPEGLRATEGVDSLLTGVEMTERALLHAFEKHGIQKIEAEGEKFDPSRHQAMFEVETTATPPGHVVQVMQAGYVMKDRLLRPALVGVAKAPGGNKTQVDETI
ncbi:MAG: nucleotide exchange factor GrpE [Alphaproteobacteria bacterium]|nr:MAG: nucleotide exchange factor GrpE [Alphaproteobacteria bacterium]